MGGEICEVSRVLDPQLHKFEIRGSTHQLEREPVACELGDLVFNKSSSYVMLESEALKLVKLKDMAPVNVIGFSFEKK